MVYWWNKKSPTQTWRPRPSHLVMNESCSEAQTAKLSICVMASLENRHVHRRLEYGRVCLVICHFKWSVVIILPELICRTSPLLWSKTTPSCRPCVRGISASVRRFLFSSRPCQTLAKYASRPSYSWSKYHDVNIPTLHSKVHTWCSLVPRASLNGAETLQKRCSKFSWSHQKQKKCLPRLDWTQNEQFQEQLH